MEQLTEPETKHKIVSLFVHRCVFKLDTDSLRQEKNKIKSINKT